MIDEFACILLISLTWFRSSDEGWQTPCIPKSRLNTRNELYAPTTKIPSDLAPDTHATSPSKALRKSYTEHEVPRPFTYWPLKCDFLRNSRASIKRQMPSSLHEYASTNHSGHSHGVHVTHGSLTRLSYSLSREQARRDQCSTSRGRFGGK